MARLIQIHLHQLSDLACDQLSDRKTQIAERKREVAFLRNQLLSQSFELPVSDQQVVRTNFGKPYLNDYPDFSFNHSHSHNFYALATSKQVQNLGIDIEELNRKVRFEALAQHAFHPEELKYWKMLAYDPEYWFKVWTTKEAVLKASGLGIRINLNELNTNIHPEQNGGRCEHPEIGVYAYQNYSVADCMLTVAWQSEHSCKGLKFPVIQLHHIV
ncbi:4'-phosphopantetheinyl transferase sfp [Prolinoborus fasciculus]|uniref:4'-phosphopantetheinyl transferase family protein n=1 Tax=Acinetobacter lwoffii TaxID=28090 RepID=UPI000D614754|nr:4'-phosphopantetheinyl transferase superfamily protein [Prolinoborus fasciculus]SPJ20546.1 4'-phosphopantetheinyl transferase sfp [Prolinoborus fasciculus]